MTTSFKCKIQVKDNDTKYKVKGICNNTVYAKESKSYRKSLYYLVYRKTTLKKKILDSLL